MGEPSKGIVLIHTGVSTAWDYVALFSILSNPHWNGEWSVGGGGSSSGTPGVLWVVHSWMSALCRGPVIHSVTCSDSLSTSISVSATMVKIKEGSVGPEKESRQRKGERERREREKLASKAEAVHAGNTEITPPGLIESAPFRHIQCEGQFGIVEFVPFREFAQPWMLAQEDYNILLLEQALDSSGPNPHLTDGIQSGAGLVWGHCSKVVAGPGQPPVISASCSGTGFLTAHTLPVCSQPLSPQSLWTHNF